MDTSHDIAEKNAGAAQNVFDRDDALDKALALFWAHGYEATSLADLVSATGAKAPTLYAEFGNKEGLFRAVMDRYVDKFTAQRTAMLADDEISVSEGIESYLRATAACFLPIGKSQQAAFFICTSTALSSASGEIARMLRDRHQLHEETLNSFLRRRQKRGELPACTDTRSLARYLTCMLQGMSVRARDGATRDELDSIIDTMMALWSRLAGVCEGSSP